ncbi:kinetochore complex Sim4 subunit Fta1-domain-containing protein [Nemania sp. NC0429]|nr:kinetochore complex Sim4 subunit Fta1-domain-containing protein [Nemania sp. NC0429]
MPPKRRGRRAAAEASRPGPGSEAEPEPEAEPAADDEDASDRGDEDGNSDPDAGSREGGASEDEEEEEQQPDFRFFDTTFSTFRVSPLYTARNALTPAGLETLSRRLRDALVGDVVRGVQVGLEGGGGDATTLGRLGALERVEWRACALDSIFPSLSTATGTTDGDGDGEGGARGGPKTRGQRRGGGGGRVRRGIRAAKAEAREAPSLLCLELEYERAAFSALMLPSLDNDDDDNDAAKEGGKVERRKGKQKSTATATGDGSPSSPRKRNPPSWTHVGTNSRSSLGEGDEAIDNNEEDATDAFAHFPLLLTRMPTALKTALVDFLSSTFDCRISPLRLGTRTLVRSWERWIEESGVGRGSGGWLNKDVALTLGFHLEPPAPSGPHIISTSDVGLVGVPAEDRNGGAGGKETSVHKQQQQQRQLGLKTIDVIVPADEVRRFLRVGKKEEEDDDVLDVDVEGGRENGIGRGRGVKRPAHAMGLEDEEKEKLRRKRLGGGRDEEGWGWRRRAGRGQHTTSATASGQDRDQDGHVDDRTGTMTISGTTFPQPFTNALATYLSHHLALDIYHPGVRVLRVVCDAFALSEGRMKVFAPSSASSPPRGREREWGGDVAVETFMRDLVRRARGPEWGSAALRLANLEVLG